MKAKHTKKDNEQNLAANDGKNIKKKNKAKKILGRIGIVILALILLFVGLVINHSIQVKKRHNEIVSNQTDTGSDYDYIDIETSDERGTSDDYTLDKINGNKFNTSAVEKAVDNCKYDLDYSEYYDLDNTLNVYHNTPYSKNKDSSLVTNGSIDADKLYNTVLENNKNYMNSDDINHFYSEADSDEIKNICDVIAQTALTHKGEYDVNELSDTLSHLTVFRYLSSTAFAFVSSELCFVINPNMVSAYDNVQTANNDESDDGISVYDKVVKHETEHLLQYISNDYDKSNGIEAGFCRKYDNVNVNSLWDSFIVEGTAEIQASEDLNTDVFNYEKKIAYLKSYELANLFNENYSIGAIEKTAFTRNLEEAFDVLNLKTNEEKMDFLKLMYTIEITQSDCDDFWQYYETETGKTLTEEEQNEKRVDIRTQAISELSKTYYKGLSKYIKNGKIEDIQTVFYFLRVWEIDCFGHMQYTRTDYYPASSDFLKWQYDVENTIFRELSKCTDMSYEDIVDSYDNYNLNATNDGNSVSYCNLSNFNTEKKNFANGIDKDYNTYKFAGTRKMVAYIDSNTKEK